MDQFINGIHQVSSLYGNFGELEKTLVTFSSVMNHAFRHFCKNKLARAWIFKGNRHNFNK